MKINFAASVLALTLLFTTGASAQENTPPHHWNSHVEVARKVLETFDALKSYTTNFNIQTQDGNRGRVMNGVAYYSKPGKVRYEFANPAGNLIVSDGKILWVYISRLRTVGKQDLSVTKKNESDKDIFTKDPGSGLARLFSRYHYRFDGIDQPRKEDGVESFVLDMEQREKIGGYEKIKLFIDAKSYLIYKAIAGDGFGKKTTITFSQQKLNETIEGSRFQYQPDDSVKVVTNPLVSEE